MRNNISQLTRVILIIELILAFYMMIVLFKSLYDSHQIEQYISDFEAKNEQIAQENSQLEAKLAYYKSEQYQDKIAKQNFGYINPGEKVLILPHSPKPGTVDLEELQLSKRLQYFQEMTNPQKWWHFMTNN